jgi:predicted glycoside hydrolase/deacetylase ChbG (UPF0249 family)
LRPVRRLVVNADDFGFTPDVNEGIVIAHREGILTATTLMANGPAFQDAVSRAKENPSLDVGCHLVLVGGYSLLDPDRPYPTTVAALVKAVTLRQLRLYDEFAAQVRRILDSGIRPTHLDTHKHTHVLPSVLKAVARISEEFRIPWVRRPLGGKLLSKPLHRVLKRYGCRTTDHFAGFELTGRFGTAELVSLIEGLPEGTTELMCHPGICGSELLAAKTRLKESRQRELEALTAPETRAALTAAGVELISYRDL